MEKTWLHRFASLQVVQVVDICLEYQSSKVPARFRLIMGICFVCCIYYVKNHSNQKPPPQPKLPDNVPELRIELADVVFTYPNNDVNKLF